MSTPSPGEAAGLGEGPVPQAEPAAPTGAPTPAAEVAPRRLTRRAWLDVLRETAVECERDNIFLLSAGQAFYTMLAVFPALFALVSLYAIIADPGDVKRLVGSASAVLPESARELMLAQLTELVKLSQTELGVGIVVGIVVTLWSGSSAVEALIVGVNIAHHKRERRGFVELRLLSVLFTLGISAFFFAALFIIVAVPAGMRWAGLGTLGQQIVSWGRWPGLAITGLIMLAFVYRFGPQPAVRRFRVVSWGAGLAMVVWVSGSFLFSLYLSNFDRFNRVHGAITGVLVLQLWFFITSFSILLGAELDAAIARYRAGERVR